MIGTASFFGASAFALAPHMAAMVGGTNGSPAATPAPTSPEPDPPAVDAGVADEVDAPEEAVEPRDVVAAPSSMRAHQHRRHRHSMHHHVPTEEPAPVDDRELTTRDVQRVIGPERARLQQCYTTALRHLGEARDARVLLTVEIAPEGHVSSVAISGQDFEGMGECLRHSASVWRFPVSRSGGEVPVPLRFSAVQ